MKKAPAGAFFRVRLSGDNLIAFINIGAVA